MTSEREDTVGPGMATSAWPAGQAVTRALAKGLARAGVTQITLFNNTVPRPPSAIGTF